MGGSEKGSALSGHNLLPRVSKFVPFKKVGEHFNRVSSPEGASCPSKTIHYFYSTFNLSSGYFTLIMNRKSLRTSADNCAHEPLMHDPSIPSGNSPS